MGVRGDAGVQRDWEVRGEPGTLSCSGPELGVALEAPFGRRERARSLSKNVVLLSTPHPEPPLLSWVQAQVWVFRTQVCELVGDGGGVASKGVSTSGCVQVRALALWMGARGLPRSPPGWQPVRPHQTGPGDKLQMYSFES